MQSAMSIRDTLLRFISASKLLQLTTINGLFPPLFLRYSAISNYTILRNIAFVNTYSRNILRNFAICYLLFIMHIVR